MERQRGAFRNVMRGDDVEPAKPVDEYLAELHAFIDVHNPYRINKVIAAEWRARAMNRWLEWAQQPVVGSCRSQQIMREHCVRWGLWVATQLGAALVFAAALAPPIQADSSGADKRILAEMALQWAVDGGISDFKLVKDPANIVVSNANLPDKTQPKVPGRKVTVVSPLRIQAYADIRCDFLYFRFGQLNVNKLHATVPIALVWAVSGHSTASYLSGGGATLEFEKNDGKWQLLPVTERWTS